MEIYKKRARWLINGPEGLKKFGSLAEAELYKESLISASYPLVGEELDFDEVAEEMALLEEFFEEEDGDL